MASATQLTYVNVMEALVEQEVELQLQKLSPRIAIHIRPEEVVTYALNRLAPLYACSKTGEKVQQQKAKQRYGAQIKEVVTWGFRAVQKDPIRKFTPLASAEPNRQEVALQAIQSLLQDSQMNWEALQKMLRQSAGSDPSQNFGAVSGNTKEKLSWQNYKNRRSERANRNYHSPSGATGGAAGQLRLFS